MADERQRLSRAADVAAARQILASADVRFQAEVRAGPLPEAVDDVLATVLHEAVTNFLRYSAATACTIEAAPVRARCGCGSATTGSSAAGAAGGGSGHGLANLTARVHAAGGRLACRRADGRFDLTAEIPLVWRPG